MWRQASRLLSPGRPRLDTLVALFPGRTEAQLQDIARGGYILEDCAGEPEAIVIATGSELALARDAAQQLKLKKIRTRNSNTLVAGGFYFAWHGC